MANVEQLARLRASEAEHNAYTDWNQWRRDGLAAAIDLTFTDLTSADLTGANLTDGDFTGTNLSAAILRSANLSGADFTGAILSAANFDGADLSGADFNGANLTGANFRAAYLSGANLSGADLSGADLSGANFDGANLTDANFRGADLYRANLSGANLNAAIFDKKTNLTPVSMNDSQVGNFLAVQWNDADLTGILWNGERLTYRESAVQAAQQMTVTLRNQGLSERADRFAYQARLAQRRVYRERGFRSFLPYLGSLLLWAISGYGYRPSRTFVAYLLTVGSFAAAYYVVTHTVETQLAKLSWDEALVLSLTSFHGRGFLPGFLALGDWVARIGALEAVIGLFIELILIATFSRRFLGN